MNRLIASLLLLLVAACASAGPVFVATDARVEYDAAEAQCVALGGHVAPVTNVDAVLAACRDADDTGPCWVALSSAEARYAITIDGHIWAVPIGAGGEALAVCEVR